MEMDERAKALMEKCKIVADDPSVVSACKIMLETLEEKKVKITEAPPKQTYLKMAETLSTEDVPRVLEMALMVTKSKEIKDPDVIVAADRLIRAIEMC